MIAEFGIGTTNRRRALDAVLPHWLGRRREAARAAAALQVAKEDQKAALGELGKVEDLLAHVTQCDRDDCLRCEELATNGVQG